MLKNFIRLINFWIPLYSVILPTQNLLNYIIFGEILKDEKVL